MPRLVSSTDYHCSDCKRTQEDIDLIVLVPRYGMQDIVCPPCLGWRMAELDYGDPKKFYMPESMEYSHPNIARQESRVSFSLMPRM